MSDPRSPASSRARVAQLLREQGPVLAQLFAGADMLVDELADLLEAPVAPPDTAAAHGSGRAREDAAPEALAREFAELRRALSTRLDAGDAAGPVAEELHDLLDRQYAACIAAFLREREALLLEMIAHDISNPLMNICLCRDYLAGTLDASPEQQMVSDMLQSASQRLQEVTRGLHEVADLRGSPSLLERRPLVVAEVVAEVVAQHAPAAASRGVRLEQSLQLAQATVLGEHERLVRALGTVLQSALRAASADRVVTLRGSVAGGEVLLRVSDVVADLGGPSRSRKRTTTEMFVARSVVEAHGGRIWLEPSDVGRGTTLALSLPLGGDEA